MCLRALTFGLLLAPSCLTAGWIRVVSPRIEVFTDAGEKSGRSLLARFEEISDIFPSGAAEDREPVRVFEFSSEAEFHAYHDTVNGFYRGGPERDYIALYAGPDAGRVAFHEYVHLVLSHSPAPLPVWFEEGTAEFYSTLSRSGNRWRVGEPIDSHVARLGWSRWFSAAQLQSITARSVDYDDRERRSVFYSESWALVHMLNLSPVWRPGMASFALLLSENRAPEEAFHAAFGKTLVQAIAELPNYLRTLHAATIGDAGPHTAVPVRAEPLQPVPATLALVDFALDLDRPELARRLMKNLPMDSPEVVAAAGAVARAERKDDEARRLLTQAIQLGSRDAATYFEYAMVEQESGAASSRVEQLLNQVLALNPNFADARFLLGVRQTDEGRYDAAIEHLKAVTRLRPKRSDYWHALGYAQSKAGRAAEALVSARRALATASTTGEEGMAQGLTALAQEHPAIPSSKRPDVITPSSWARRKGDASMQGVLIRFDCSPDGAKMLVRGAAGEEIALTLLHPGDIELINTPSEGYQFSCGAQEVPVVLEYFSATHDVTRIEFRP
jgi:tetratricopeptide (TPR) repeat protein